jgi:formylglycine-generating enzyme required for sulfatase activity
LVEQIDPDRTFRVAYWYGPSGCGKSSLVKAGLIPALAEYVKPIYVEASAADTESHVLRELRKAAHELPTDLELDAAVEWLAAHPQSLGGRKVLLVIDQFEQWLHASRGQFDGPLAAALRHASGRTLQCLLLVRDEFKVAAHRFMKFLEIEQRENFNYALIDLLDADFAREVLFEYGRGYRRLPETTAELTGDQKTFLDRVIADLRNEEDGKVVSVQLALLAQMLESQSWLPATLDQIGGAAGIGRAFLEDKFDKRSASAACQLHRGAAVKLFEALLPESGAAIKGRSRSRDELLELSGYARQPKEFAELIKLLDTELRILTPVDTGKEQAYQLTHDYLVPSLRNWLTAKQRETWRGRAFLVLAERTSDWARKPQVRALPGPLEYLRIVAAAFLPTWGKGLPSHRPTASQRHLLWAATRWYGMAGSLLLALVAVLGWWRREVNGGDEARLLCNELNLAKTAVEHRSLVDEKLTRYRPWIVAELHGRVKPKPDDDLTDAQRVNAGERRADEAIALVRLNAIDETRTAFQWQTYRDPEALTQFVFRAPERGVTAEQLWQLYERATIAGDNTTRFAATLTLGVFDKTKLADVRREQIGERLKLVYAKDANSGIHSATGWLLGVWQIPLPALEPRAPAKDGPDWIVTQPTKDSRDALTLIRVPKGQFVRRDSNKPLAVGQTITLTHDVWLSDREVTVGLFRQFVEEVTRPDGSYRKKYPGEIPDDWEWDGEAKTVSPDSSHPVQNVSWDDAVMFCNWLSRREGRETVCYLRESKSWKLVAGADAYRLPTEAEWEYACRAGTTTTYSFGSDERLLRHHACYGGNYKSTTYPVATQMPNAWGLYDMHGNVFEWCQDLFNRSYDASSPAADPMRPEVGVFRVIRGGSWNFSAEVCRSSYRDWLEPSYRGANLGFRVARSPSGQSGPVQSSPVRSGPVQ